MACRLAGKPVPQRAAATNKRAAGDEIVANESPLLSEKPRVAVGTKHPVTAQPQPAVNGKRPAADHLTSGIAKKPAMDQHLASKQARVEDASKMMTCRHRHWSCLTLGGSAVLL